MIRWVQQMEEDPESEDRLEEAFRELDRLYEEGDLTLTAPVGEKRYSCRQCGESFTTSPVLAAHVRIKHPKSRAAPSVERAAGRHAKGQEAEGPSCSLCGQDLSPFARNVASALVREGAEERQAVRYSAIAQRCLLRGGS